MEPVNTEADIMVPLSMVRRLAWDLDSGKRFRKIRESANEGRRVARSALSQRFQASQKKSFSVTAIQDLEEGKVQSVDVTDLQALLEALGSRFSDLFPVEVVASVSKKAS